MKWGALFLCCLGSVIFSYAEDASSDPNLGQKERPTVSNADDRKKFWVDELVMWGAYSLEEASKVVDETEIKVRENTAHLEKREQMQDEIDKVMRDKIAEIQNSMSPEQKAKIESAIDRRSDLTLEQKTQMKEVIAPSRTIPSTAPSKTPNVEKEKIHKNPYTPPAHPPVPSGLPRRNS